MINVITFFLLFLRKFLDIFLELFTLTINLKFVSIIVIFCIIFFINNYNNEYLYKFPDRYILKTYKDHIINIFIICIYPLVFIFGILYLRVSNMNRNIDLFYYYENIKYYILLKSNLHVILTIILLLLIFRLYLKIIPCIIKSIRFNYIKRHLYLSDNNTYFAYYVYINDKMSPNTFRIIDLTQYFCKLILKNTDGYSLGVMLGRLWYNLHYYIHYFVLCLCLIYDIIFNDYVLSVIFTILPFIFIYELKVKLCKFTAGLNLLADNMIYHWLYSPSYVIDDTHIQLGPLTIENNTLRKLYMYYILTDFVYDHESEKNEDISPEEILKNKKITWSDVINIYYKKFKIKLKEIFIEPLQ